MRYKAEDFTKSLDNNGINRGWTSSLGRRRLYCGPGGEGKIIGPLCTFSPPISNLAITKHPRIHPNTRNSSWAPARVLRLLLQSHLRQHAPLTTRPVKFGCNKMAAKRRIPRPPRRRKNKDKPPQNYNDHYPQTEKSAAYPEQAVQPQQLPAQKETRALRHLTNHPHTPHRMVVRPMPKPRLAMTRPPATGSIRLRSNSSKL